MINITFTNDQLGIVLRALDQMPHAQVRQVIDMIITEANRQQQEAAAKQQAAEQPKEVEAA